MPKPENEGIISEPVGCRMIVEGIDVDEIAIFGRDDERHSVKRFLAHYDVPAYVRRARQVEETFEQLLAHCRQQREDLLTMVRTRLSVLRAMGLDWDLFRPWLKEEKEIAALRDLHTLLQPEPRLAFEPRFSSRAVRRALRELCESIQTFNRRWQAFLQTVDLTRVNESRAGYNRYYLLEKECAVRSPRLARQGFRRLEPLTLDDLAVLLPPLPVPMLAE